MSTWLRRVDLVIAVAADSACWRVVPAACRGGALGVLPLDTDPVRALEALSHVVQAGAGDFGVRVPAGCRLCPADLPAQVQTIILDVADLDGLPAWAPSAEPARRFLLDVTSVAEARRARAAGAAGLIAKGAEAGGRIGSLNSFVLLQQVLAEVGPAVAVWSAGGIGTHTAAAAVAGGAAGIVLDSQLALVAESELPHEVTAAIAAMDGTETTVVHGNRFYTRPDLPWHQTTSRPGRIGWRDLWHERVPVGSDGASAARFAQRFRGASGVVRAFREAIGEHLSAAVTLAPLAPGRGLAGRPDGLRVAQGPMTRVSDRPEFAASVADAGGLPFLALALMDGDQASRLLADTARRLGDRPWGVGILGFAPPEVRAAQLGALAEIRPPCALIAGGHPDQAAPLEALGIVTYLHAPSADLLEQYLRQGARRFVFEGSECGGHVGPRGGFALWDAQVECLLAFAGRGTLDDVEVLFAGGIHDERSGAMVAGNGSPVGPGRAACIYSSPWRRAEIDCPNLPRTAPPS